MRTRPTTEADTARNQLASFRVFPQPRRSKLHYVVRVFRTRKDMDIAAAAYRSLLPRGYKAATVVRYRRDAQNRLLPQRGEVFFCLPYLDVGSIAHEFTHVALAHARDARLNLHALPERADDRVEESVAEMMDTLTSQATTAFRKRNIPVGCHALGGN